MPGWGTFFDLGGVAGVIALGHQALRGVADYRGRPKLRIEPIDPSRDLREWVLSDLGRTQRVFSLQVSNDGRRAAVRCIATLSITSSPVALVETKFSLHWADLPYSHHSSAAPAVDVGSEGRRLDVVFTVKGQAQSGCWVAIPMALSQPVPNQALLPPGAYEATVTIQADNAKPASLRVRIEAPQRWDALVAGTLFE